MDKDCKLITEKYLSLISEGKFNVKGYIIFKNPNGTGVKYVHNINEIVYANSKEQAVFKTAKTVAMRNRFGNSYYEKDRGYTVTELPDSPPPQLRLPYRDD